jgi:hypothetical protein
MVKEKPVIVTIDSKSKPPPAKQVLLIKAAILSRIPAVFCLAMQVAFAVAQIDEAGLVFCLISSAGPPRPPVGLAGG